MVGSKTRAHRGRVAAGVAQSPPRPAPLRPTPTKGGLFVQWSRATKTGSKAEKSAGLQHSRRKRVPCKAEVVQGQVGQWAWKKGSSRFWDQLGTSRVDWKRAGNNLMEPDKAGEWRGFRPSQAPLADSQIQKDKTKVRRTGRADRDCSLAMSRAG